MGCLYFVISVQFRGDTLSVPGLDPVYATSGHAHLWHVSVSQTGVPFYFSSTPVVGVLMKRFQMS